MTVVGQSLPKGAVRAMSGLPSSATGQPTSRIVSFVPKAVGAGPTNSHVENVQWQAC
jgi:hypothetical protein